MGCAPSKEEPGQIALKDVQADVAINSGRRMTETKRRIAVRAETTDLEEAFTPPTYPKSEDAKDRIRQGVVQNAQGDGLLKELTAQQKEDMINAMIEVTCKAGDLVIKQGEDGDHFYLVDSGKFEVYLKQSGEKALRSYDPGDSFGELALLYNSARAATVKCVEDGVLWALERKAFRYVMVSDGSRDIAYRAENFLKTVEILSPLTDAQRADLASVGGAVSRRGSAPAPRAPGPAELSRRIPPPPRPPSPRLQVMEELDYTDGQYVVQMGETADALYFVKEGEVVCHQRDKGSDKSADLMRLKKGGVFGAPPPRAAARRAPPHAAPATTLRLGSPRWRLSRPRPGSSPRRRTPRARTQASLASSPRRRTQSARRTSSRSGKRSCSSSPVTTSWSSWGRLPSSSRTTSSERWPQARARRGARPCALAARLRSHTCVTHVATGGGAGPRGHDD